MKRSKVVVVSIALVLALTLLLCACTPSKDAVRAKYQNAGYLYDNISAHTLGLSSDDVEYVFAAHRVASEDGSVAAAEIEVVLFVDETKAQEYSDAKAAEHQDEIEGGSFRVALDGNFVLSGTPEAVELF